MIRITFLKPIEFSETALDYISKYDKKNNKIWGSGSNEIKRIRSELRDHYRPLQEGCCSYCRIDNPQKHGLSWDVDHIAPQEDYPQFLFEPRNLSLSCKDCNTFKNAGPVLNSSSGDFSVNYPENGSSFYIIHPHFDEYSQHMGLVRLGDSYIYTPLSNKGQETFKKCKLSRFSAYKLHNITNANIADAFMKRLREWSDDKKIGFSDEMLRYFNEDLLHRPVEIVVNTDFKKET
ncbi:MULTISPECIES: HNH endonuclease [Klebsiella pneumoniae complex]|uniref:HNH endonuclease n=1 Tax=Klebsiella pneumoniae complex TaxID=3390273 RepID=UPI000C7A29A8|nr:MULTISPECIES: HNH endonuclease [Klebsiella]PLF10372.1 hypothetical protein B6I87_26475 [Klebsiella quasipneumoniae]HDC4438589.1 HNH endonuclease [Klebsiella quasipneumoniae]